MTTVRAAFARYPWTEALLDGRVEVAGFDLDLQHGDSIVQAYRAMARDGSFGACEMAPLTYLAARAAGAPIVAIPVFTFRRFHHGAVVCPAESDITGPDDLVGRRVGVRAYSVTSALWARGVWADEYGVDADQIIWVTDDDDNVPGLRLPDGLVRLREGASLRDEYAHGRLDACFTGVAGLGRHGAPADWGTDAQSRARMTGLRPSRSVIADAERAEEDWYRRTQVLPAHGLLVVHRDLLQERPDFAGALTDAFIAAKHAYFEASVSRTADDLTPDERVLRRNAAVVGGDPLPFGLGANAPAIAALLRYAVDQRLIDHAESLTDLFLDTGEDRT